MIGCQGFPEAFENVRGDLSPSPLQKQMVGNVIKLAIFWFFIRLSIFTAHFDVNNDVMLQKSTPAPIKKHISPKNSEKYFFAKEYFSKEMWNPDFLPTGFFFDRSNEKLLTGEFDRLTGTRLTGELTEGVDRSKKI